MKKLVAFCALLGLFAVGAAEPHAEAVIETVLAQVAKIKAADPQAVPMAFWDFDGTLIKGDLSEGFVENGVPRYKGLIEETTLAGLCTTYAGPDGWRQYRDRDYPRLLQIGRWIGWPYNAQIFKGKRSAEIDDFCVRKCDAVYRHWLFAASFKILRALEERGVENYVISASPDLFVRNTGKILGLDRTRLRGIRVKEDAGFVTTEIEYPLPMGPGKVETLRRLVLARPHGVAVAGFGNSYSTDGNFLRYIVTQHLPGGAQGFALMINGGTAPAPFAGLFQCVNQSETCAAEAAGR